MLKSEKGGWMAGTAGPRGSEEMSTFACTRARRRSVQGRLPLMEHTEGSEKVPISPGGTATVQESQRGNPGAGDPSQHHRAHGPASA